MTQKELDEKIAELQKQIDELKQTKVEVEQPKRWKPKDVENYWSVEGDGNIYSTHWCGEPDDEWYYLTSNCFRTKEEAEEYKKQIEYTARYKNYIEEHSEPLDWNNGEQKKYGVYFHTGEKVIQVDWFGTDNSWETQTKYQGMICASSEEIIWDAIEEIGEDNFKKYVLEVE